DAHEWDEREVRRELSRRPKTWLRRRRAGTDPPVHDAGAGRRVPVQLRVGAGRERKCAQHDDEREESAHRQSAFLVQTTVANHGSFEVNPAAMRRRTFAVLAVAALGIVACVDVPDNMRAEFAGPTANDRTNYRPGNHGSAPPVVSHVVVSGAVDA